MSINLTENEQAVLNLMAKDAQRHDACGWTSKCRPADMDKKSYPGVVSSLSKKKLIKCWEDEVSFGARWKTIQYFQLRVAGVKASGFDASGLEMDIEELDSW